MDQEVRQRRRVLEFDNVETPKKKENEKIKNKSDPSLRLFLIYVVGVSVVSALCIHLHTCLPEPLSPNEDNTRFSELRAMSILHELSDYGPKPTGSHACEELTRGRILRELKTIQSLADPGVRFEVATQNPSGCFSLPKFDTDGFSICYKNVSNVIARIGKSGSEAHASTSIMLNCHYDSWPTSSAGSDDLSSCALMLELLRILSHQPEKLKHDVIFLFNGAEESSLLASHGFITQHPWRHSIRAFINLEASGSGGRELLFQAGPSSPWLLHSYLSAAVHPHCSVLGQEIFQSGVYPGDTDFRIFRDYGRIPGLDVAFVQNGYWWHTEFDEAKRIRSGSLQRAGENVLSTLLYLLDSPYLSSTTEENQNLKSVFFDVIGLFVVVYPLNIANTINIITAVVCLIQSIRPWISGRDSGRPSLFVKALFLNIALLFVFCVCGFVLTKVITLASGGMLWYSRHWIVFPLYVLPLLTTTLYFIQWIKRRYNHREAQVLGEYFDTAHEQLLSLILLYLTYKNIASSYLVFFLILPTFADFAGFAGNNRILRLLLSVPGIALCVYTSEMLLSIFIPIMGRTSSNSEPLVLLFTSFALLPIIYKMVPLALCVSSLRKISRLSLVVCFLSLITVCILFPNPYYYSDEYPTTKRTQFFHVNRRLHDANDAIINNDSLIYAIAHDNRGAEDIHVVDGRYTPISCVYKESPFCEIPFYFPTRERIKERHIRYRQEMSVKKLPKSEISLKEKKRNGDLIDYDIIVKGSGQVSVYISTVDGSFLVNHSLPHTEEGPLREKNHFFYLTCSGDNCGEWRFQLTLEASPETKKPLLIAVVSHFLHGEHMESSPLIEILRDIKKDRHLHPGRAVTASAWTVDMEYRYL